MLTQKKSALQAEYRKLLKRTIIVLYATIIINVIIILLGILRLLKG